MEIGIFAKTFNQPTLDDVLDSVHDHGLKCVQFNMVCAGQPSMPDAIDEALVEQIRSGLAERDIRMEAISGTFNMIHPDVQVRQDGLRRLEVLARAAKGLGTGMITLCTGTRDAADMWRGHPENASAEAWADLRESMEAALKIAEEFDVRLGVEPEVSNVVSSARKARQLLDEMQSPRLKVIMDAANLFQKGDLPRMRAVLDEAFDLVGGDIGLAHAKDLSRDGEAGHEAAGTGLLDYDHYIWLLRTVGYEGGLILHGLREEQVGMSVAFLKKKLGR
ncbi:MAG: sugar phosphate isomerase/epimerase [Anaerolineae bacterium]|nr:sugar phosphate isomerase/epimerase [Anaerolineae bacterium]